MHTHSTKTGALNVVQSASAVNESLISDVGVLVNKLGEWVDDQPVTTPADLDLTGRLTIARAQLLGVAETLGFSDIDAPNLDGLSGKIQGITLRGGS